MRILGDLRKLNVAKISPQAVKRILMSTASTLGHTGVKETGGSS
jgi:hypothetical protein